MDKTAMLARLDVHIQDQDNFSFDPTVKTEAYNTIVNNDPWVYILDIDKTQATSATVHNFTLDDTIEDVYDIKVDYLANGYPQSLGTEYWEYINGVLNFNYQMTGFPAAKTLWIYVRRKLADSDIIPGYLQGYVLEMTAAKLLDFNIKNKVFRFLHNDTTLGELQVAKREALANARELRKTLPTLSSVRR